MSLNDYFAANGAVYMRPMAIPDCFSMPGLPPGLKPPPMPPLQQQKSRTMAAVSPLHQPPMAAPAYDSNSYNASRGNATSSFAAALRKLAKQAGDPVAGDKGDPSQLSPVSSPSLTPKRGAPPPGPPPMFLTNHQVTSYGGSSPPPVVTIAPSRPVATHTSESRKVMDLSSVQQSNSSTPLSNGHLQEAMKMDSSKGLPRPAHSEKWDESSLSGKGLSVSSASSQVRPHATIAPLPRPDDSVTSSRGFQPYRGGTEGEPRNTLPHHLSLFEHHPHAAAYPYAPAFLPPHHLSHPAYRFDDPLYLERYSLLRPPMMPYPQPSMMGPPAAFYQNSRYAADLIAHSISNNNMLNHERLKAAEEERRIREKELELDQSRMKDQEQQRQREREHKEQRDKDRRERTHKDEHYEHRKSSNSGYSSSSSSSKRTESPSVRTHTTPNHLPPPTAPVPLNLVLQNPPPHGEPQKKEAELWMPWQQPASNTLKDIEAGQNGAKHPAFRTQGGHRHHQARENHMNDKSNLRFSPSTEKKHHGSIPITTTDTPDKKHSTTSSDHNRTPDIPHRTPSDKRFEHASEHSTKDTGPHEWRHEKLQKACTNIHRKSHESSKKAKEERFQNHHRKTVVNGAILKPTAVVFQNEGMHARLLESEKCRLEMNGHSILKPSSNSLVPNYNKSAGHPPLKDLFAQKSYADYFGSSVPKSNVEVPPVVSKLDIGLKRLKKGEKMCVDEEKEEKRLKNLLVISKVPPLKFDSNPHKLNFLRLFGLTTHLKKKKIEFDLFLTRRKRLRLDSNLEPAVSPESSRVPLSPILERKNPFECLTERLRLETESAGEKTDFLFKFNLKPVTQDKREEQDRLRRRVIEEKIRRHYRILATANRKSSPKRLFVPKSEAAQRLDQLKKLSEMNSISNGLTSNRLDEEKETSEIKFNPSSHTVSPKVEQVPYAPSSESPGSSLASSPSVHKSPNKYSFKRGHSLKRESRFAHPQSLCKSNQAIATSCSVSTQVESAHFSPATIIDKCVTDLKTVVDKSGNMEAVMEVIYRYRTEQSSEKTVLSERCQQLRLSQEDLKKQADALSRQMSDLLKSKRELDDERQKHQKAIDHLKKCLQLGR